MIARLLSLWRNRPDPYAEPTGYRYTFTGHDAAAASKAVARAKTRTPRGTPLRLKGTQAKPEPLPDNVRPMRRKA